MHKPPTVLLIDDDADDQEIFGLALEKANSDVNCVFANDGIEALEKLHSQEFRPDYIFIDINMPRMNGRQCLVEIRKMESLKNIPVYMYSTSADPEAVAENKSLGATDFIVKSHDIYVLSRILSEIFQKQIIMWMLLLVCFAGISNKAQAQPSPPVNELKKLSVEELMNLEVTSVSRSPEKLTEAASAVQVVSGNDIKRSTATRLPEAMRLAHNIQIAQSGSHDWGVTSRGFNGAPVSNSSLADKLLVMIDGRSVYTPLFGGVFWDVQNVFLEDVDRIEIVSGPGGTLWGSNAVNGVVNVISKEAKETQGVFASAGAGILLQDMFAARFGSHIDSSVFFRVYGQHFDFNSTDFLDGTDAGDSWNMTQAGFRMDSYPKKNSMITLQGDLYSGREDDTSSTLVNGQNLLARWSSQISENSSVTVQGYFDRTYRNIQRDTIKDNMLVYDIEAQHNIRIGNRNNIVWGIGYRYIDDYIKSSGITFDPAHESLSLASAFIQDRITVITDKLDITIGTKVLHNSYTDFEFQPSVRFSFATAENSTVWGAASRAVRTPSRYDSDLSMIILGSYGEFKSEVLNAYEAGFRIRPFENVSVSIATFFNQYTNLRSIDSNLTPPPFFYFANSMEAETYGLEVSASTVLTAWLRLRAGYSFIETSFTKISPLTYINSEQFEAIDPQQHFLVHLISDIAKRFQFDVIARYVDVTDATIFTPVIPSYFQMNAGLGWKYKWLTLRIAGQNLLSDSHHEFGFRKIPRNIYGKIAIDF